MLHVENDRQLLRLGLRLHQINHLLDYFRDDETAFTEGKRAVVEETYIEQVFEFNLSEFGGVPHLVKERTSVQIFVLFLFPVFGNEFFYLGHVFKQANVHIDQIKRTNHIMRNGSLQHLQQVYHLARVLKLLFKLLVFEEDGCAPNAIQSDGLLSNFHDCALLTNVAVFGSFLRCLGAHHHKVLVYKLFIFTVHYLAY